jgi:mono/diheme cytochrome c family protein
VKNVLVSARGSGAWRLGAGVLLVVATLPIESCAGPLRYDSEETSMAPKADAPGAAPAAPTASPAEIETAAAGEDLFASSVRPILSTRCAPCHNPGGKMYERLPFDDPKTVASHAAGVSKRLKGDDLAALQKWVASLPLEDTAPH